MAQAWLVQLSGEHPTLPAAELQALLAVHAPGAEAELPHPRVAIVQGAPGIEAALARMALAHAWGPYLASAPDDEAGIASLAQMVAPQVPAGSIAVERERLGGKQIRTTPGARRTIGGALADAGHAVDLKAPEYRIRLLADGEQLHAFLVAGEVDRGRFEGRIAERKEHFSPVTLHPRRAASLLHLARVPPGGRAYDPFCGTGTFLIEATLEGLEAWGSDLDPFMVQGTLQGLADAAPEPLAGTAFQGDVEGACALMAEVDGIVSDLPYGRASTTDGEGVGDLYRRACLAMADLLAPGGRAVLGCAQADLLRAAAEASGAFDLVEEHAEFVHRSLTRHYLVLRRR
ncbi:MAG: hypothetical protein ACPGQL_06520 [Thermoplasmatota archaeon]